MLHVDHSIERMVKVKGGGWAGAGCRQRTIPYVMLSEQEGKHTDACDRSRQVCPAC